jgi:hypothetical protein
MTLDTLIIFGGAFVAALPFLGFPNSWDKVLLLFAGIFIVALGIVVRRRTGSHAQRSADTYAESTPEFRGAHEEV